MLFAHTAVPVTAGSDARTLWLYHTHTHEEAHFTYWHDGQYDQTVLDQMNVFLADWRNHVQTHMDPHLFDLLWEVYQELHATQPYNIVSAYRTPETNAYLRSRSSLVAEHSQHMLGHAMDVFIPGVDLETLRETALKHQVGGVGYYPTSGSPFVHMDTGTVRAWPRLTRDQLLNVFPDGRTLHVPVDGTPLSNSGTLYAQAEWNKCHMVPCPGDYVPAPDNGAIQLASLDPRERSVSTIQIVAPTPLSRPQIDVPSGDDETADAPITPFSKPAAMMLATRDTLDGDSGALGAISTIEQGAAPQGALGQSNPMLTAYAPTGRTDPGAEQALRMIIQRETTAGLPGVAKTPPALVATTAEAGPVPPLPIPDNSAGLRIPKNGGTTGLDVSKNFFDMTWSAVTEAGNGTAMAETVATNAIENDPIAGLKERDVELVPPELDHVSDTLATPLPMTDAHYAELYEPEGYLDNAAELGPMANRIHLESDLTAPPRYDIFVVRSPMLISSPG